MAVTALTACLHVVTHLPAGEGRCATLELVCLSLPVWPHRTDVAQFNCISYDLMFIKSTLNNLLREAERNIERLVVSGFPFLAEDS